MPPCPPHVARSRRGYDRSSWPRWLDRRRRRPGGVRPRRALDRRGLSRHIHAGRRTFYFFKKTGRGESFRIFSSSRTDDRLDDAEDRRPRRRALRSVSGDFARRAAPGVQLVSPGARHRRARKPNAHLWSAARTDRGWSAPVFMAQHEHARPLSLLGRVRVRRRALLPPDDAGLEAERDDARAVGPAAASARPEPYAEVERWKSWRADVRVAGGAPGPGGRLVFLDVATTNPRTGRPASDIWISIRRGDGWTDPGAARRRHQLGRLRRLPVRLAGRSRPVLRPRLRDVPPHPARRRAGVGRRWPARSATSPTPGCWSRRPAAGF